MPAGRLDQTFYVGPYGSVDAFNTATLYKPGELGGQMQLRNAKGYQLVLLDSGATSATGAGVPLNGHTAYWKNRATYTVTNDKAQAETTASDSRNSAAGVFLGTGGPSAVAGAAGPTAGNYCFIQQRGTHVGILTNGSAAAAGDVLVGVAAGTSATAAVVKVTAGTAPTNVPFGIATAATGAVTANYTPARLGGWDLVDQP